MAKKVKFHFNPETLNYEPVKRTFSQKLKRVVFHLFSGVSLGALFFFIFIFTVQSPQVKELKSENRHMQAQYKLLNDQMGEVQVVLTDLQQRDDNLYRVVFQADPIPLAVRRAIPVNIEYYNELLHETNSQIVVATSKRINELKKELYVQSKSYDQLVLLSKNKSALLQCIPAIQPVLNKDLRRVSSGFGWRIDPVYHTRRFHDGMDFAAPIGTDIFATGNGRIIYAGWMQGYGNCVMINHGFGYQTLYGHMSKIKVKLGQKVKRGQVIGLVGSTGKSTGPHVHYEVHYRGKVVDPKNYYFLDLSPADYDKMIQMSNNSGRLFD